MKRDAWWLLLPGFSIRTRDWFPIMARSAERTEFLTDVLACAIEHNGYGFLGYISSNWTADNPVMTSVTIIDRYEEEECKAGETPKRFVITLDTIAHGFSIIRAAVDQDVDGEPLLHNAKSGQRLYLSHGDRKEILACDRANDASEIDVVYALAVLECALFGAVTYN